VKINGKEVATADHFVHFNHDGIAIEIEALENSIILVLSGEPIDEQITQYGPFLMNTPEEIREAISDYNQGKFGYLEE
jgi:redox-sensitive bicupin YhaK (pirin superfamily)